MIQINSNVKLTITKTSYPDEQKAKSVFLSNRLVQQSFYQKAANPYYASENEKCLELLKYQAPIRQLDSYRLVYSLIITLDKTKNLVDCTDAYFWARKDFFLAKNEIQEYEFISKNLDDLTTLDEKELQIFKTNN